MSEALRGSFWQLAIAFAITFFGSTIPGHSQNFRVQTIMVCSNKIKSIDTPCTEVKAPFENLDKRKFLNNRIYIKLTIVCEKEALSFIDSNDNFLPIYIGVWKNGTRQKGDVSAGITQEHWEQDGDSLRSLISQNGNFPWRTHFHLSLDRVRTLAIQITDAQKNITFIGRAPARLEFSFSN